MRDFGRRLKHSGTLSRPNSRKQVRLTSLKMNNRITQFSDTQIKRIPPDLAKVVFSCPIQALSLVTANPGTRCHALPITSFYAAILATSHEIMRALRRALLPNLRCQLVFSKQYSNVVICGGRLPLGRVPSSRNSNRAPRSNVSNCSPQMTTNDKHLIDF